MIQRQISGGNLVATIMATAGGDPILPPLCFAQIAGLLPLAANLLLGDITEYTHGERITNLAWRIQRKVQ